MTPQLKGMILEHLQPHDNNHLFKVGGATHTLGLSATRLAQYWMILMASMLVSTNGSWEVPLKYLSWIVLRKIKFRSTQATLWLKSF